MNWELISNGGGFLLKKDYSEKKDQHKNLEVPTFSKTLNKCVECEDDFLQSFIHTFFELPVCDLCKNNNTKYSLITKTDAKFEFLLKDCDLDKRTPVLKFIKKKNPHNPRWGDMKLFLRIQIEKRALEIWKTEECLMEEKVLREQRKEKQKTKKRCNQLEKLRKTVRSSIYNRTINQFHQHIFGEESFNHLEDTYSRICIECHYKETFEKM